MKTRVKPVTKDRLGLMLVAVTLIVMAAVGFFAHQQRLKLHQAAVQQMGQALVRAIAGAEPVRLADSDTVKALLKRVITPTVDPNLAYVAVTKPDGLILSATGPITPQVRPLALEPHAWFGNQRLSMQTPSEQVHEFYGPIMHQGSLEGFVRLAYFAEPRSGWWSEMPFIASLLLPVVLLMASAHALGRYELKSLTQLGARVTEMAQTLQPEHTLSVKGNNVSDFRRHFEQFMELVQSWTQQTRQAAQAAQTSAHLTAYRQEKLESVLNALPDALLMVNEDCIPTFVNPRAEHLMGKKSDAMIGHPVNTWCDNPEVQSFLLKFRNAAASPGIPSLSYTPNGAPDQRILVSVQALMSPRDANSLIGRLVLFRDLSAEYMAHQSGAEFVAHASHELKTPLATLAAYSEQLLDYATLDETERVNAVNVINEEARRMASLINNLLNISKLESGTLTLSRKRVKLHEMLQDAYDALLPVARQREIDLQLRIPPDLGAARLDKDLLRIAVDNLLENGVKYSNLGGRVTLSAEMLENSELQISVRDQGIGISRPDMARVFDKFYRSSSSEATHRRGHGLGLYLARQIVELHQGRITVESELGKGTLFTISLRAQPMSLEETVAA